MRSVPGGTAPQVSPFSSHERLPEQVFVCAAASIFSRHRCIKASTNRIFVPTLSGEWGTLYFHLIILFLLAFALGSLTVLPFSNHRSVLTHTARASSPLPGVSTLPPFHPDVFFFSILMLTTMRAGSTVMPGATQHGVTIRAPILGCHSPNCQPRHV